MKRCGWNTATTRRRRLARQHLERGLDLAGMVGVVVDDQQPGAGIEDLETPLGQGEAGQAGGDGLQVDPDFQGGADGGERVGHVVPAADVQAHPAAAAPVHDQLVAGGEARGPHLQRPQVGAGAEAEGDDLLADQRHDAAHVGVVVVQDHRPVEGDLVGELPEGLDQVLHPPVEFQVVVLDVGHHGDAGEQPQEAAVRLVGLGDQVARGAQLGAAALDLQPAADHVGGVEAGLGQYRGQHGGGGGLAVRAGDGQGELHAHQLGQHLGARDDRQLVPQRRQDLDVVLGDGAGVDQRLGVPDVGGGVADGDAHAQGAQAAHGVVLGDIRAADLEAHVQQHLGDAGHARAADAGEVDLLDAAGFNHGRRPPCAGARR